MVLSILEIQKCNIYINSLLKLKWGYACSAVNQSVCIIHYTLDINYFTECDIYNFTDLTIHNNML